MPFALIIAFAASLGLHLTALFGPEFDLATEPESLPLIAQIRPLPQPPRVAAPLAAPLAAEKAVPAKARAPRRKASPPPASATPLLSVPDSPGWSAPADSGPPTLAGATPEMPAEALAALPHLPPAELSPAEPAAVAPPPRLPQRMKIHYRVDRGDSNFEIGYAQHDWQIDGDRYRLSSVVETTGIVWLFKSIRLEMESQGLITAAGLRPETFAIRRNGRATREQASFDWERMTVRVGARAEQALAYGAQDLLSFNYQLGYLPDLATGSALPIATGKKYGVYRLELVGDEEIEVPAGSMRTVHLRAPGENTTELWLAYDYLLLPVKIRHVDAKGDSFVQVATQIQLSQ